MSQLVNNIKYKSTFTGFKLNEDYIIKVDFGITKPIIHKYFSYINGILTIRKGYWWNGVTCWFTTKSSLEASLVHDTFYQMMELRLLPLHYKLRFDNYYEWMLIQNGAWEWYARLSSFVLYRIKVKVI